MARWDNKASESEIPAWFWRMVETPAQQSTIEVEECDVAYQVWGESDKPGLLLIHGMNAHKHWWDFIAPHLLEDWRVVAMDLTGMGDSDFRYSYDAETYASEIYAVCNAARLDDDVVVVGHSFGGRMATKAAAMRPGRFGALVLVDSGLRHPDEPIPDYPTMGGGRAKLYPSREEAESRFRLFPPQPCSNEYLLQYIAKKSLMYMDGGWMWKFDDELPVTLKDAEGAEEDLTGLQLPVAIIYGENSVSFTSQSLEYMRGLIPELVACEEVKEAQHHVFLDQPLGFVEALKRVLSTLAAR